MAENLKPLIDGDILVYQAAFGGEGVEEIDGEEVKTVYGFDYVAALLDKAIADICLAVGTEEEPIVFLTGDNNFREEIAVTKPYKGNRSKPKPFHYYNARAYLLSLPFVRVVHGLEADDAMAIEQTERREAISYLREHAEVCFGEIPPDTVICTRDKDLRMVPGWHYGWEHGGQPEFFLQEVDDFGRIEYDDKKNKVTGTGYLFFCSQLITGDTVDNIPGLPKKGPKAAWVALKDAITIDEAMNSVEALYQDTIGEDWESYLMEQGKLLWMVRGLDKEGKPIMWDRNYGR